MGIRQNNRGLAVKRQLQEKTNTTVVTFDAWAHEGDSLRRAYIESIVSQLKDREWCDPDKWNKILKQISHRTKTAETTSTPKPTALARTIAISAFFVPIGTVVLREGLHNITFWPDPKLKLAWMFLIGLALTAAPIIVIFSYAMRLLRRNFRAIRNI